MRSTRYRGRLQPPVPAVTTSPKGKGKGKASSKTSRGAGENNPLYVLQGQALPPCSGSHGVPQGPRQRQSKFQNVPRSGREQCAIRVTGADSTPLFWQSRRPPRAKAKQVPKHPHTN
ncbi:hypothetical protein NDU88_007406 [Pleurodeles waltl]|uniref:Uncharacterized protein n=1 Tax=Pleurodeles waltl TaxID=8319 RepID=A0AAV7N3C6_PLEWA|nr:hypothetical protein NDU88_007406 [Pleurodeles waltl]